MSKKTKIKADKGPGCFVSCCMGWTIGVVVLVMIGLLLMLAIFTFPFIRKEVCELDGKSLSLSEQIKSDSLWRQCGDVANYRNACIGQCQLMPPAVIDPPIDLPLPGGGQGGRRPPPKPAPLTDVFLNRTWSPRHYQLRLQPMIYNASDARLPGSVEIFMTSTESTNVIVLHAVNLTVDQGTIELRERTSSGQKIMIKDVMVDTPRQFIKIYTYDILPPSREYYLKLNFEGTLLHPLKGFYRGAYSYQNSIKYVAVSQFEEVDARRAFPCFDEPSFKATFTVTLVRKPGFTALSNTDLDSTQTMGEWRWDTFKKTPVMSTYILAMFVGAYTSRETTTPKGTKVRVWTQPDYIEYSSVALEVTGKIIEAFEDYTGIRYPLNKTDQVAVADFGAGAMENWGLIIYTQGQFLLSPAMSTTNDRRAAIITIAHEIAHQWFGNLVTMRWWDDTFLNEGFATYMGNYIGVPAVRPEWNEPLNYIGEIQKIMIRDTAASSQPVRLAGLSAGDNVHKAFSQITYNKGAAVVRMFRYFLKEETFKKAIRNYLREFSYSNAVKDDLISVLDRQARADSQVTWDESRASLAEIATSWLDQANYPLLEVTDLQGGRLRVKQSRFVDFPEGKTEYLPPFSNYSWHVPFTYANQQLLNRQGYTMRWIYRDDVVNFQDSQVTGWKLANIFFQGFYRVWYDDKTWTSIVDQLDKDHTLIPVESRSEIIDDAFALASQGYTDEVRALRSTRFLVNETENVVFDPFFQGRMKEYTRLLRGTPSYTLLSSYVLELILPTYNRLGWTARTTDIPADRQLRLRALTVACSSQYQPCVLEALRQFQQLRNLVAQSDSAQVMIENPIDPDLRSLVYCMGMKHGNSEVFRFLLNYFVRVQSSNQFSFSEITAIVSGLVCAEEPVSLDRMLQWAISLNNSAILEMIAARPGAASIVAAMWEYMDNNWGRIPTGVSRDTMLWMLTETFATPSDLQKLRHFLTDHREIHPLYADELLAKVKDNVNWVKRNEPSIRDWLMYGRYGVPAPTRSPPGGRAKRSVDEDLTELPAGYRYPKMGTRRKSKFVADALLDIDIDDLRFDVVNGKVVSESRNRLTHRSKN